MNQHHLAENNPHNLLVDLWRISYTQKAEEIYITPSEKSVSIKLRVDGQIVTAGSVSTESYQILVDDLDKTNKHGSPVFDTKRILNEVSLHIVLMLTRTGYEIMIRPHVNKDIRKITELGFTQEAASLIKKQTRHGATIITGPTASGKTTSLFSMLDQFDENKRIVVIEETPEMPLDATGRITQIETKPQQNMPMSTAVTHALRFCPDVLALGELREKQSAKAFVDAANMGHTALTTFHAHSPVSALKRMMSFDITSYMVAENISLVIAQKLEHRLCDDCKLAYYVDESTVYKHNPAGCGECFGRGYKGRVLVYDILSIDSDRMREAIRQENWELVSSLQMIVHSELEVRARLIREGLLPYQN